jgi:hypothetical protein
MRRCPWCKWPLQRAWIGCISTINGECSDAPGLVCQVCGHLELIAEAFAGRIIFGYLEEPKR